MPNTNKKYYKQKNKSDCGPTAVFNTLNWASVKKSYNKIKKLTNYTPKEGAYLSDLRKALKYLNFKVSNNLPITLNKLDLELNKGNSVIILFVGDKRKTETGPKTGHFVFVHGRSKNFYLVANDYKTKISRSRMTKRSRATMQNGKWRPGMITIKRINNEC